MRTDRQTDRQTEISRDRPRDLPSRRKELLVVDARCRLILRLLRTLGVLLLLLWRLLLRLDASRPWFLLTGQKTTRRRLLEETSLQPAEGDPVKAVVPTISGRAWVTQKATVVCDPSDPFPRGYKVGDIW